MKYTFLFAFLLTFAITSCKEDPCETIDNLDCPTQDFDMDGVLNGEDEEPENPCAPNFPDFQDHVIGTWQWGLFGSTGKIEIKSDGTYEDIENEILSNGEITSQTWSTSGILKLEFEVENTDGLKASISLQSTKVECNRITFDGQGFGDIVFNRQ